MPGADIVAVPPTLVSDNVLTILADLTSAERSLWEAFPSGSWVDLRAGDQRDDLEGSDRWGGERTIRAEVITRLLLGAAVPEPGFSPAVRVRGARIAGCLDVMGATVGCGLICEGCWFDTDLRFVEATTKTVRLAGCRVAGFNGTRLHAEGILDFHQATVTGAVLLDQAVIAGDMSLSEAAIGGRDGGAVMARGLAVSGDLDCTGMMAHGCVRLANARIDGSVRLARAEVRASGDQAVDVSNGRIGVGFQVSDDHGRGRSGCGIPASLAASSSVRRSCVIPGERPWVQVASGSKAASGVLVFP